MSSAEGPSTCGIAACDVAASRGVVAASGDLLVSLSTVVVDSTVDSAGFRFAAPDRIFNRFIKATYMLQLSD